MIRTQPTDQPEFGSYAIIAGITLACLAGAVILFLVPSGYLI